MVSKHVKIAVFPHFEFGLHLVSLTLAYVFKSIHQFCLLLLVTDVLFLMDNLVAFLHSFIYQSKYCFKTCENPSLLHIFGILTLDNLDLYMQIHSFFSTAFVN